MERPRLFEYPIYAVIVGVAGAWIYGLPPFTHDPSQPSTVTAQPATSTVALERQASAAPEETGSAAEAAQPRSAATQQDDAAGPEGASEAERAGLSEADAVEQPGLDPQPSLLRVTANSLNMRAAPNAQSPRVGSYPRGAVVEPVTKQGNWVLVRTVEDATTGWMYVDYLDEVAEN